MLLPVLTDIRCLIRNCARVNLCSQGGAERWIPRKAMIVWTLDGRIAWQSGTATLPRRCAPRSGEGTNAWRGCRETVQTFRCSSVLEWSLIAQPSSALVEPTPCTSLPSRPRLWSSAQSAQGTGRHGQERQKARTRERLRTKQARDREGQNRERPLTVPEHEQGGQT